MNQTPNKYGTTRANMSRETNEAVMMRCKKITSNLLRIVCILVEPITSLAKSKASIEESLSIRKTPWGVTSSKPVISPSLSSFFYFGSMMIYNSRSHQSIGYWWSTVDSYAENIAGRCGSRNRTGKMKYTESRNWLSFIYLIKGRYVLCRGPSISWKMIFEVI